MIVLDDLQVGAAWKNLDLAQKALDLGLQDPTSALKARLFKHTCTSSPGLHTDFTD